MPLQAARTIQRSFLSTFRIGQLLLSSGCFFSISIVALGSATGAPTPSHNWSKQVSVDPDYEIELELNTECSFITGDQVNIRSGPGTDYSVVVQLNRGDGVRALYRKGNWVNIVARVNGIAPDETYEPLDGWVYNEYINGCSEDQFDRWRLSE